MKKGYILIIIVLIILIAVVWKADFVGGRMVIPSLSKTQQDTYVDTSYSETIRHTEKPVGEEELGYGVGYSYEVRQILIVRSG